MKVYQTTLSALISTIAFAMIAPLHIVAQDFSTTNRNALAHFWAVVKAKERPVTVISFGDSMADPYRSVTYYLIRKLQARLGVVGHSFNDYRKTEAPVLANGTTVVPPSQTWFTDHYSLPPGASLWWTNEPSPQGVLCDEVGIFYVTQPEGGRFSLSVSLKGGRWTQKLVLDGYSPTPMGHLTNVAVSPDRYRVRVDGLSGTNCILGPHLLFTPTNGLHVVFMDQGGIALSSVTQVPASIRYPVLEALKPDLLIWHMKEELPGLADEMEECEEWWSHSSPECDVLYIGTPWRASDTNGTWTLDQNQIVRDIAVNHGRAFVDLMRPAIGYEWLLTQGYLADSVHLNHAGGRWGANLIWKDMDFSALRLPRRLSFEVEGN